MGDGIKCNPRKIIHFPCPEPCNTVDPLIAMHCGVLDSLDLGSSLQSLLLLLNSLHGLGAHDTTTPLSASLVVGLHVTILDGRDELGELSLVLSADFGDGEDSGGLRAGLVRRRFFWLGRKMHTFLWTTVPRRALPFTMA